MRTCGSCELPISEARLKAKPSATLCITCQTREENNAEPVKAPQAYFTVNHIFGKTVRLNADGELEDNAGD